MWAKKGGLSKACCWLLYSPHSKVRKRCTVGVIVAFMFLGTFTI
jgi:hypothetical protein